MRRKVVLILGMHRSGTSMLANMLIAAGVPFGSKLLSTPMPDNLDGYGEHADVVALQEELLIALGRTWHGEDGSLPLPPGWRLWPETRAAAARLAHLIGSETAGRSLWACKDPRTSRLLPLWLSVLDEMGLDLVPIVCVRDPREVAGSLAARNKMPPDQAIGLWTAHYRDITSHLGGMPALMVDYALLLADPGSGLRRILAYLGIGQEASAQERALAVPRLDHRHHVADDIPSYPAGMLYRDLRDAARGGARAMPSAPVPGPAAAGPAAAGPGVTVVMRTRDRPIFLPRALRSVLGQTSPAWHLVLVDDGGEPGRVEAAIAPYRDALGDRLTSIRLDETRGMEAASQLAILKRHEPFVVIHDDDDTWRPRFLETCVAELGRTGAAGVVTAAILANEQVVNGRIVDGARTRFKPDLTAITLDRLMCENLFPPISFVFKRSAWEAVGGYRTNFPILGDWDFNQRFLARFDIVLVPEPLALWHRRPATDQFPNSDQSQHKRIEETMRHDLLKSAGPGAAALVGVLVPLIQEIARQAANSGSRRTVSALRSQPSETPVPSVRPRAHAVPASQRQWRLLPTRWERVEANGDHRTFRNLSHDSCLVYDLADEILAPGRYRITIRLAVPGTDMDQLTLHVSTGPDRREILTRTLHSDRRGGFSCKINTTAPIHSMRLEPHVVAYECVAGPLVISESSESKHLRLPNFLGIGAQRSGTTWLHQHLSTHPEIYLPPCKEIHFLDDQAGIDSARWMQFRLRFLASAQKAAASETDRTSARWRKLAWAARFAASQSIDLDWYGSLFTDAPDTVMAGEITPSYAVLPEPVVKEAVHRMPGLRVVLLMRDPIERALSGAVHALTTERGSAEMPSVDAVIRELDGEGCISRSSYRRTIETWERHLEPDALGCFFFDDLVGDPSRFLDRVLRFLELPPLPGKPRDLHDPINANQAPTPSLPRPILAQVAGRHCDDLRWLAARFGGAAQTWAARAEALAKG